MRLTGNEENKIKCGSFFPSNSNIQVQYIISFSQVVKAVLCILSGVLFSFEVFDVFKNIQRSLSSDFCFLIWVCALTRVLNYKVFGEKQPESHCRF